MQYKQETASKIMTRGSIFLIPYQIGMITTSMIYERTWIWELERRKLRCYCSYIDKNLMILTLWSYDDNPRFITLIDHILGITDSLSKWKCGPHCNIWEKRLWGAPVATHVYEQSYMALRYTRLMFLQRN